MTVYFNFPNLISVKTQADAVPRVGEIVNTTVVTGNMFESNEQYEKYLHWEYSKFSFKVARVIWSIGPTTYVNVMLERIP